MRICFHVPESTGKSTLASKLAAEFGCPLVEEYGRIYAEKIDTNFRMADLLAIAATQNRMMRDASAGGAGLVLQDTDPLMTAAWAGMLLGRVPAELLACEKADLYLLFAPDVPWVEDGTRFFGTGESRAEFAQLAEDLLVQTGVPYRTISGDWDTREASVRAIIAEALEQRRQG